MKGLILMKKTVALITVLVLVFGLTAALCGVGAKGFADKTLSFDNIKTTVIFSADGKYSVHGNAEVLQFDSPVSFNVKGNADSGMVLPILLTEYTDDSLEFEFDDDNMGDMVLYIDKDFPETELKTGIYSLSLMTKDEVGASAIIIIGEPVITKIEKKNEQKLSEKAIISDWARAEVLEAYDLGLITFELYDGGNFKRNITRSEFAHVMANFLEASGIGYDRYIESLGENPKTKFVDTNGDMYVEFVSNYGIINGVSENEFDPSGELTREQAATMLARTFAFLGSSITPETVVPFADDASFSDWAKAGIYTVAGLRDEKSGYAVMGGVGDGIFSADTGYTVEQSIIAAKRLFNALGK